jgi:tetratricopeptide (TPR) repeat protein
MNAGSSARSVLALLVAGIGLPFSPAWADEDAKLCQAAANAPAIAAKSALEAAPGSLAARFNLADSLIEANCYDEAVHVLEAGEAIHPRNGDLQAKLRTTRSMVSEQHYFAGKEQAELAARVSRNLLRCTKLGDLNACDEALNLKPDDVDLLLAKGDALLKSGRLAEAELALRRAKQVAPDNARVIAQLAAAQSQRQASAALCQKGSGDDALKACQNALSPGAPDEFAIHSRIALLYQQRNQPAPALASYIAANSLKPGDRGVALGIVAITDVDARKDAVALVARGSALLTLNRGAEALASLRQAQSLQPAMPDLRALIARAQSLASRQVSAQTAAAIEAPAQIVQARRYSNAAEPGRSH